MTEILIDEVTSGDTLPGVGYFDEIMASNQIRLEAEFDKNRIKATEYSKVYLGAMESALSQSIAFALGRQEASAKADLLRSTNLKMIVEIDNEKIKGDLLNKQIEKIDAEIIHLNATTLRVESEVNINEKQLLLMDKDLELKTQQIIKSVADTELVQTQVQKVEQETIVIGKQVGKIIAETNIAVKQLEVMTVDIELKNQQIIKLHADIVVAEKQALKMDQEILLMKQQVEKLKADVLLAEKELELKEKEIVLMGKSIDKMTQEILLMKEQVTMMKAQIAVEQEKLDIMRQEAEKISHEIFLLDQQGYYEASKTQDTFGVVDTAGHVTQVDVAGSVLKEQRKTDAETALVNQNKELGVLQEGVIDEERRKIGNQVYEAFKKGQTEAAKTSDTIDIYDPDTHAFAGSVQVGGAVKRANDKLESENELIRQNKELTKLQEDVVKNEARKIATEKEVLTGKAFTEIANTQDNWTFEGKNWNVQSNSVIAKQKLKLGREGELLAAKYFTEAAQTVTKIPYEGNYYYVNSDSIVGKQKEVYQKQAEGFDRKFEQEMAKIMTDSYSVRRSTEETATSPNSMTNKNIDKVIDKAAKGIGINNIDTNTPSNN